MAVPQAFMTASSFLGIGVETTRGTVAPTFTYLPVESPQVTPNITWLEDKGYRGSAAELYGEVPGPRYDGYEAKGKVFLDTFPNLLRAMFGSTDTTVAAPANTTLSSSAVAGATTILTVATIPAGSAIKVGTGATLESHFTTAVSGAGPFTLTLAEPLIFAQGSGATVAGQTAHKIGLLYNLATAHQPPSYSINDFDGVSTKQILAAQGDSLDLTFGADKAFEWSTKFVGNPFAVVGNPSQSFSNEFFVPGYNVNAVIGGSQSVAVQDGEINIKRSSASIFTAAGVQSPLVNFAGPMAVTGKLTLVVLSGDTTLTQGTTDGTLVSRIVFTEPSTGHGLAFQMSAIQYKNPKINRGKTYVEVDVEFAAEANATDSLGTGYAPAVTQVGNGQTAAY